MNSRSFDRVCTDATTRRAVDFNSTNRNLTKPSKGIKAGLKIIWFVLPSLYHQNSDFVTMSSGSFYSGLPSSSESSSDPEDMAIDPSLTGSPSISTQTSADTASTTVFHPDPQASLFIDTLGQRFHLTKQQMSDLHGLFQVLLFFNLRNNANLVPVAVGCVASRQS